MKLIKKTNFVEKNVSATKSGHEMLRDTAITPITKMIRTTKKSILFHTAFMTNTCVMSCLYTIW